MKTVGELLKGARLTKNIRRTQISRKTKIGLEYIKALEKNEFNKLPEAAFVRGFIRNYANAVDLNPDQALAVFRRDYDQDPRGQVIPRKLTQPNTRTQSLFTPKTTLVLSSIIFVSLLGAYFVYQYRLLAGAPQLVITQPQDNERVNATLTVVGRTDPQATIAINNQKVEVGEDGVFEQSLILPEGTRTITIEATSRSGKTKTVQRTVQVE